MKVVCLNLIFDCFFLHEEASTRSECEQKCGKLNATLPTFGAISSSEYYTKVNDSLQGFDSYPVFSFTSVVFQKGQMIDEVKDDKDSRLAINTRMSFILNRTLDAAALVYRPNHKKVNV